MITFLHIFTCITSIENFLGNNNSGCALFLHEQYTYGVSTE